VAVIPHEAVPNFFKNPPGNLYRREHGHCHELEGQRFSFTIAPNETRLFEYTPQGVFVREIGRGNYGFCFSRIRCALIAQDNIWAVDEGTDTIVKFNPAGQILMTIGRRDDPVASLSNMAGAGDVSRSERESIASGARPTSHSISRATSSSRTATLTRVS